MARTIDTTVTRKILDAALDLAGREGVANLSMEAVATRARVGKPAIYRRYAGKAELLAAALLHALPPMELPQPSQDPRSDLRALLDAAVPRDPATYATLIGSLMAERHRHPELIRTYRDEVLAPRRAVVREAIVRGQAAGVLDSRIDPEFGVDFLGGAFMARTFAGLETGPAWREQLFETWIAAMGGDPAPSRL